MTPAADPGAGSGAVDELRALFQRGEYDSVATRAEQLLKRHRVKGDAAAVVAAVRAAALIQLSRGAEARTVLEGLSDTGSAAGELLAFARLYLAWVDNERVAEAVEDVRGVKGSDARVLEAQLLYRMGMYEEAAEKYRVLYDAAAVTLAAKKTPAATSRWLPSVTGRRAAAVAAPVTAAEIEHCSQSVMELATNLMAALVLAGKSDEALKIKNGLPASYELEYNAGCASIHSRDFDAADLSLEKAEALFRGVADDDEDDIEQGMAPIRVQRAYLKHVDGGIVDAEKEYADVVAARKADAASLAVAANNLSVALGQLAFDKQQEQFEKISADASSPSAPTARHNALVEGLKKMKATSGRNIERKLTNHQRRAMARNRAILLVQMGRLEGCRTELGKLKTAFPDDPLMPLIESALVAKQNKVAAADKVLLSAGDSAPVRAARAHLAAEHGEGARAAQLLQELFPDRAAASVTAASLLNQAGDADGAITLLRSVVANVPGKNAVQAKMALADLLLRNEKYEDAATVLREALVAEPKNHGVLAQLVVATSYFDAEEAERMSAKLPSTGAQVSAADVERLEALPPPKRRAAGARVRIAKADESTDPDVDAAAARAEAARERKRKKRKKRLPKNYDPNGPPPDPERWLPKTLRSTHKKKKKRNEPNNFRGSQGADAASADAAATKNAERSAARAAAAVDTPAPAPPGGRSKVQRKKKNRR